MEKSQVKTIRSTRTDSSSILFSLSISVFLLLLYSDDVRKQYEQRAAVEKKNYEIRLAEYKKSGGGASSSSPAKASKGGSKAPVSKGPAKKADPKKSAKAKSSDEDIDDDDDDIDDDEDEE